MANIELPKDAEGREIPLDTSELFIADGTKVQALRFEYMYHTSDANDAWFVYIERTPGEHMTLHTSDVRLTPLDSWEKLEEDLGRTMGAPDAMCAYFGDDNRDCVACRLNKESFEAIPYCNSRLAFKDILDRIRKLRGEGDA